MNPPSAGSILAPDRSGDHARDRIDLNDIANLDFRHEILLLDDPDVEKHCTSFVGR